MAKPTLKPASDIDPIDHHIGQQIKILRITQRMSQEQLGKAVGVTFQQIQKYENGVNRVSAAMLYRFSQILGVQTGTIFEGLADIGKTPSNLADAEQRRIEILGDLNDAICQLEDGLDKTISLQRRSHPFISAQLTLGRLYHPKCAALLGVMTE